ncbi:hypothetical protein B0I37DRAFT_21105 [Chaetomium sp. MPI-CAGE-AT-0009]|nr:hypothetical protein B0I37DRAFT_21105 [Chaetomium sp. MPI-CAGE-AT-0009]
MDRHREILVRTVANILPSPIAKQTYSQIVEVLPLSDVGLDVYPNDLFNHPVLEEHKELCPGVAERADKLRASFDVSALLMPSGVSGGFKPPISGVFLTARLQAAS